MYHCASETCDAACSSYKGYLLHVWDKHSLEANFSHLCGISGCTRLYTCKQSFLRHLKSDHNWFYTRHYEVGDVERQDRIVDIDEEPCVIDTGEPYDSEDDGHNTVHSFFSYEEAKDLIGDILLELRERYNCTTEGTCYMAEKISQIIDMDRRHHCAQVEDSLKRNMPSINLDYETKTILKSPSVFHQPFIDFKCEKSLSRYIEQKEMYVTPITTTVEDPENGITGSVEYVPIFETLQILLQHEDMLNLVLEENRSEDGNYKNYCDGSVYKNNVLFKSDPLALQIILYHDDYQVANPLGNKTIIHKMSSIYLQLGNIPFEYRSQINDIQLVMVYQAKMLDTFGYKNLLKPLIKDLKLLETNGVQIKLPHKVHLFRGTVTMVIADNLAAHALSGHFCNFSTVQRFCRFCLTTRDDINSTLLNFFQLRTVEGHDRQIQDIAISPDFRSLYGISEECCLNELKYFHSVTGFPPDFAHDMLEGFCRDVTKYIVLEFVSEGLFSLQTVNEEISSFPYSQCDKSNPPQNFKVKSPISAFNFKYTACEMWNFVRLLPLMIAKYIPEGNQTWKLYLDFLDLFERLTPIKFLTLRR